MINICISFPQYIESFFPPSPRGNHSLQDSYFLFLYRSKNPKHQGLCSPRTAIVVMFPFKVKRRVDGHLFNTKSPVIPFQTITSLEKSIEMQTNPRYLLAVPAFHEKNNCQILRPPPHLHRSTTQPAPSTREFADQFVVFVILL